MNDKWATFSRGSEAAKKSAPAKRGAPSPAMILEAFLLQAPPMGGWQSKKPLPDA